MKRWLLLATLLTPCAALAVADPTPGTKDTRIRTTRYDPDQVVRLTSTGLAPLEVIFEASEHPVTIAGAMVFTDPKDAKDWLARSSGNVLILQPLHAINPSVLFVRTETADGQERHYAFELRTRNGDIAQPDDAATLDPAAYMTVRIVYPTAPKSTAATTDKADRALDARFAAANGVAGNFSYDRRCSPDSLVLAPWSVSDDGVRTTLLFAPNAVLPEVYVVNQDGKEAITTPIPEQTANGLRLVVPTVQREMRLRRGSKVCALRNNAFDPIGIEPGGGSGTISPQVERRVRVSNQ